MVCSSFFAGMMTLTQPIPSTNGTDSTARADVIAVVVRDCSESFMIVSGPANDINTFAFILRAERV